MAKAPALEQGNGEFKVVVAIKKERRRIILKREDRFFLSEIFTLLTATVTISAPEALIAFAVSNIFLYFPVPTINLDLRLLLWILNISFFTANHRL